MKRGQSSSWSGLLRFGVVGATIVALPLAALLLFQPPRADAAPSAEATAAVQTIDKVTIAVTVKNPNDKKLSGPLQVELIDAEGKVLATSEKQIEQTERTGSYDFEFPVKEVKPEKTRLRCKFGKEEVVTDLPKVLLVKAHETSLAANQVYYPGSSAALRCEVHGVKSLVENVPLPNSTVEVTLKGKDGKTYPLYSGKTESDGGARAEFQVPPVAAGNYVLEVATKSALGEEKLTRDVQVKSEPKILLVTDKPLYQPGQMMHVRAMCLRPFDLTPVEATDLNVEIEDAKGNKVFKRTLKTSDFGVAAVDFQLADEVNMGAYQVRAAVGNEQSQKTVEVKKYVLPKFKNEIKTDKTFYLPKETIVADIQSDYFFGKPVAKAKVKVTASTFDVQFKDFQTANITTDETGHAKLEIKLPDYFVGQPLQKGDALVKLEIKITDTADHTETVTKTIPVADQPIRVSLIPEGGRLVPGIENRIFAAAVYPDGSPVAKCEVTLWKGTDTKAKPATTTKTNDSGLAEFRLTPKPEEFHQGQWVERKIEMLGGVAPQAWGPQSLLDLTVAAKDAKGATAQAVASLNSEPFGENVLLRLDKAIYRGGDAVKVDVLTSAGLPTTYLDVVKGGQTMLTRWLDVKDGKASDKIELPPAVFGTLEIHAYQTLTSGEIIRDSRVIYVHPRQDLKIDAKADRDVYTPGQSGKIVFTVTDSQGKPTAAALGVIVVDEAVYALQEMQPGLEKVYFTLQEELLKPQVQNAAPGIAPPPFGGPPIGPGFGGGPPRPVPAPAPVAAGPAEFKPNTSLDALVRDGELPAEKQQIAEVLLTAVKPKPPTRWQHDPAAERKQKFATQVQQIANAVLNYAQSSGKKAYHYDKDTKTTVWKRELLSDMAVANYLPKESLKDPVGKPISLDSLTKVEKRFTAHDLATGITRSRMNMLHTALAWYSGVNGAKYQKDGKWEFPAGALTDAAKGYWGESRWLQDGWGNSMKLVKRDKKIEHKMGNSVFDFHEIVSAGPDGKFDTDDDLRSLTLETAQATAGELWFGNPHQGLDGDKLAWNRRDLQKAAGDMGMAHGPRGGFQGGFGGGNGFPLPPGIPMAGAGPGGAGGPPMMAPKTDAPADSKGGAAPTYAAPTRLREYFPETLLWRPTLITDRNGRAEMPIDFADSITTWRLTASANSKNGGLGGVTTPLRVFQDFFVDLDLPVALTQNDEVSFPVAVYNYLKDPQTVKLELQSASWFELVEGDATRSLDLKPNEVTSVTFRIKARKIGFNPLTVKASGTKLSDAIKRSVEVVPDGQKVEQVVSDKLGNKVKHTLTIPENAVPDASKLIVKMYPGVFSQVLEGTEGMLRMPGGCMEQTSSSAYPNVLVVDYLKKTRTASPQIMMTAENYLNVGYQRLLTFERPGGGFDWWAVVLR
jgi:5-hydroxyisourate hydrolase-like protein (transthyretin family)